MAIMDDGCRWSSIPASKRASHVIIIGFLCVSLAAGLSNGGEFRSSREHADIRQHHNRQQQQLLHSLSATLRDADNSASTFLANMFDLKHHSLVDPSRGRNNSHSNNINNNNSSKYNIHEVKSADTASPSSSSSLSLLTASVLSRLNFSSSSARSSGTNRALGGERSRSRGPSSRDSLSHHHLRPARQSDANTRKRVRRRVSQRGNSFRFKPKTLKQLFCRTNYRLAVHEDGTINGTRDNMNVYSLVHIQAQRRSYVSIKGDRSKKYICVDHNGNLRGEDRVTRNCFFQESLEPNFFNTYAFTMTHSSSKRRNRRVFYLSINKDGVSRIAKVRSQKKSQFLPVKPPSDLL